MQISLPLKVYLCTLLLCILQNSYIYAQKGGYTVSGFVTEKGSKEQLPGVNVFIAGTSTGAITNAYGFYSLRVPTDSFTLVFTYVGFSTQQFPMKLDANKELNVDLSQGVQLTEVVISSEKTTRESESARMSTISIPITQIKEIPALFGEKDVLKVIQLMPGVQKSGEGNTGIYVRGGGPDQNLIILDEAPVYNANHLFGFFSIFNGDALKSVELTKGGFPARYGGRLSSVIDMRMKEGNKEKIHGEGGMGIVASRLTLEGPILKGKSSFIVSGRRTYIDILAQPFMSPVSRGGYYFYDLNGKVNYDLNQKNKFFLSGYLGNDKFYSKEKATGYKSEAGIRWGNATISARWNHVHKSDLFANTSLIYSRYRFNVFAEEDMGNDVFTLDYLSGIKDITLKHDYDWYASPKHQVKAGVMTTYHTFTPRAVQMKENTVTGINENSKEEQTAFETGLYIEDTWAATQRLKFNGGFRLSSFITQGTTYIRPEPRISGAYMLSDKTAIKASYATMNQYIHLLTNTGIGLPTDLWVPTTTNVLPQQSNQIAAGVTRDFEKNYFISIEGYYKTMNNIIGYKDGASFLDFENINSDPENKQENAWEKNVTQGQGWSYGMEFLLQKKSGKFSGWIGYTLSWSQLQFDDLNNGKKFFARYDRRHDISLVGIYKFSERFKLAATWVYGSGNAVTLPLSSYSLNPHTILGGLFSGGSQVDDYGEKNGFRMAAYHRLDLGLSFTKKKSWGERSWELGFYNAYSRANPFYYFSEYDADNKRHELKQVSLFPVIPYITYNFKF